MMIPEIQQLSAWLADSDIGLLELHTPQGYVRLRRDGVTPGGVMVEERCDKPEVTAAPCRGTPTPPSARLVVASSVGVFLHHHPLRNAPLAPPGIAVKAGQTVGLLQIGPLLLPVAAPQAGVVATLLVAHGSVVGYGAALIELHPPMTSPLDC